MSTCSFRYVGTLATSCNTIWKLSPNYSVCAFGIIIKNRLYSSVNIYNIFFKRLWIYDTHKLPYDSSKIVKLRNMWYIPFCRTLTTCDTRFQRHNVCDKKVFAERKPSKFHGVLKQKKDRLKESGQTLLNDIKETKNKMKEKMEEVIERENVMTIPNLLCISRILVSPYLGFVITQSNFNLAFGLFVFAGFTDLVDGWVARTYPSQATKIGSFLDPMADKILVAILFVTLTYMDLIPIPLTVMIIARDLLLVIAGFYIRYKSLPPPRTLSRYFDVTHATAQLAPTFVSKVNTVVQLTLVATTLASPVFGCVSAEFIHALWYLTGATTVVSACSYILTRNTYKFLKPKK